MKEAVLKYLLHVGESYCCVLKYNKCTIVLDLVLLVPRKLPLGTTSSTAVRDTCAGVRILLPIDPSKGILSWVGHSRPGASQLNGDSIQHMRDPYCLTGKMTGTVGRS